MDAIRPATPLPFPAAPDRAAAGERPSPAAGSAQARGLDPAVSLDLSDAAGHAEPEKAPEPLRRGFERDAETRAVVFRISDAASGEVVLQIPDAVVVKARAYARPASQPVGERVARTA